jgi:uncharacterized protein (DUF1015 family)
MPRVQPFAGIYYNPKMIADLSDVVTPPYDNIPDEERDGYLNRSPYNFTHAILPRENDPDYVHTAALLTRWRESKILLQDNGPHYYLYRQSFEVDGRTHHRMSLMCTVPLSEFGEGHVRPHENTHGAHKEDRLRILRATQYNLSHVFAMVQDPEAYLASLYEEWMFHQPLLRATTKDGVEQLVWRVEASKAPGLSDFFADKPLYILDGHHRYSSALMYAKEKGVVGDPKHPAARMLFSIANNADPALKVFPTHRKLKHFDVKSFPWAAFEKEFYHQPMSEADLASLASHAADGPRFALWVDGKLLACEPKHPETAVAKYGEALSRQPVIWSDERLLTGLLGIEAQERVHSIHYERDWKVLWKDRERSPLVVFHSPPAVNSVARVADQKGFMPQKSTYFFPKLAAGLILRDHRTGG